MRQYESDFEGENRTSVQSTLDNDPVPVILGPGGMPYAIDSHHGLCAVDYWASKEGEADAIEISMGIIDDQSESTFEEFEACLVDAGNAYLLARPEEEPLALPTEVSLSTLPTKIQFPCTGTPSLPNDVFRSLASFVRKALRVESKSRGWCPVEKGGEWDDRYCLRGMNRPCREDGGGVPFFEFMWSYFLNDVYHNTDTWYDTHACGRLRFLMTEELIPMTRSSFDIRAWESAAMLVTPVCRDGTARDYRLPSVLQSQFQRDDLPGVVSHPCELLPEDPSCDFTIHPSANKKAALRR
jgi:hypothetical protein